MSNFPAIPLDQKTEKNVKLFLDGLAGRMGIEGRAVTYQDLFDAGIIQLKDGVTLANLQPGTNPTDVIEVPTGELPQNPTVPTELATASSWGAIFLTWEYDAYNNEYGTEVWRSSTNDRGTASLIAVSTGRAYTDNVGAKETHFYWVRNRSKSNTVSGYNQLAGVQGSSNLITTAEDFVIANPDIDFTDNPFNVVDFNPGGTPDWKMLLLADVIIEGDLSMGQLTTGKARSNTTFTIGNGTIEIGSDSSDQGFMLLTGDGGIAGNDYLRITDGTINAWVYDTDINDHVLYKSLRHFETGVTQHAVQTIIPGFFKSAPEVFISFEDVSVYNHLYPDQDQTLIMNVGPISLVTGKNGSFVFTPTATLVLSAGVQTELEDYNVQTSSETASYLLSPYTFLQAEGFSVTFTVGSAKVDGVGDYQNRKITCTVKGSLNGGAYVTLGTNNTGTIAGDGLDHIVVVSIPSVTKGNWELQYFFLAEDVAGTTPGGGEQWDYYNGGEGLYPITTGDLFDIQTTVSVLNLSDIVTCTIPSIDTGTWTLYKINYSFNYDMSAEQWNVRNNDYLNDGNDGSENTSLGLGTASVPAPNGQSISLSTPYNSGATYPHVYNEAFPPPGVNGVNGYKLTNLTSQTGGTSGTVTVAAGDIAMYMAGKYTFSSCTVAGSDDTMSTYPNYHFGTAKARIKINSYDVDYYFRKPKVYSTTPNNHFKIDSVVANLGAQDISLDVTTINYLAVGE